MSELFQFCEAPAETEKVYKESWKILSVDDEASYQDVLELAISGLTYEDRPVEVIKANSAASATNILSSRNDISVILLDVVMETDDAGFFLIDTIRNVIGDSLVRVVLLTGQPGIRPRKQAIYEYDIAEYWNKTDLSAEKLSSVIISNLRTWKMSHELFVARRGLQMIVNASRALTAKQDIDEFASTVLEEIAKVINVPNSGGFICMTSEDNADLNSSTIVAASQHFKTLTNDPFTQIFSLYNEENRADIKCSLFDAFKLKQHIFNEHYSVLYFDTSKFDQRQYLMFIDSPLSLDDSHIKLLQALTENISSGFVNQALMNKLSQLAYLDSKTNINNRNWLTRELNKLNSIHLQESALVLFRLQNYDVTEMIAGGEYADSVKLEFINSLKSRFPEHYLLSVWDEETIAMVFKSESAPIKAELEDFRRLPTTVDEFEVQLHFQVGILDFGDVADLSVQKILFLANMALKKGRLRGIPVHKFSPQLLKSLSSRMHILSELKQSLHDGTGFYMVLQPKVDMVTEQTVGFEALLRWKNSKGDMCPPNEFIPVAEASGLSIELSEMVLNKTIALIQTLQENGFELPVSFNMANSDIQNPAIFQEIKRHITQGDVPAHLLELEITESQARLDYTVINPLLEELMELGVKISIDDFGTGYSSLAQLSNLAASTIKVDKQFVQDLTSETSQKALHIIQMLGPLASSFDFSLVAEGVETIEQKELLLSNNYRIAQGFLFAKPMNIEDTLKWLKVHPPA